MRPGKLKSLRPWLAALRPWVSYSTFLRQTPSLQFGHHGTWFTLHLHTTSWLLSASGADCWPGWGGPSTSVLRREAHPELHPHTALGTRADVGGGPGGSSLSPRMRTPFNKEKRATDPCGCTHFQADSGRGKKKKRWQSVGPGRNTQEHRCMCPPAPAVSSVCLPLASFVPSWLGYCQLTPERSQDTRSRSPSEREPGDNSGKGHPFLEGSKFSVPENKR